MRPCGQDADPDLTGRWIGDFGEFLPQDFKGLPGLMEADDTGYDATTTAQIATRAGVTERTYFRHFADKREVLFDGEQKLRDVMCAAIASAPADLTPLQLVLGAYRAAVPLFVAGRAIAHLVADDLRAQLAALYSGSVPAEVQTTQDPLMVVRQVAEFAPHLPADIDQALGRAELEAVTYAALTGGR